MAEDTYTEIASLKPDTIACKLKSIFGDLVTKVEKSDSTVDIEISKDSICFTAGVVRLTLINGYVIDIWTSEWGGIAKIEV